MSAARRIPADLYRPAKPRAAILIVHGLSRAGRRHPDLVRLACLLGQHAQLVLVPELEGLVQFALTGTEVEDIGAALRDLAARGYAVGIAGFSFGAGPALLAAADAPEVRIVGSFGGYADLANVIALCAGCAGAVQEPYPPAEGEAVRPVYVTDHGWHTGIVVRQADIPVGLWPTHRDFAGSEDVEVGWGDRGFFLAPRGTLWLALKAAFWSTSAVLHVVAFDGPPDRYFAGREVVALRVSERGFRPLANFVAAAWATDESGEPIPLGPGLYPRSRFYLAPGGTFS